MSESLNLIQAGLIDPCQFPRERLVEEVAIALKLETDKIEEIRCLPHQLWAKIPGLGVRFVSYRRLPIWQEKAIAILENCQELKKLKQLGEIFQTEVRKYQKHYPLELVQQLREIWAKRRNELEAAETYLAPIIARQQEGKQWQNAWAEVIRYSSDRNFLELMQGEIMRQSMEFADLPEVVKAVKAIWEKRWWDLTEKVNVI